tara:strand:- start:573 stop:866 length:294 start_codon:yes stop_codon:yes gene_type:complete
LVYIHEHELIHRDIKPDNILYVYEEEVSTINIFNFDNSLCRVTEKKYTTCHRLEGFDTNWQISGLLALILEKIRTQKHGTAELHAQIPVSFVQLNGL